MSTPSFVQRARDLLESLEAEDQETLALARQRFAESPEDDADNPDLIFMFAGMEAATNLSPSLPHPVLADLLAANRTN